MAPSLRSEHRAQVRALMLLCLPQLVCIVLGCAPTDQEAVAVTTGHGPAASDSKAVAIPSSSPPASSGQVDAGLTPTGERRPEIATLTEQAWQAKRRLQFVPHQVSLRGTGCIDFVPAPAGAPILPRELCALNDDGVLVCDVSEYCTSDADCRESTANIGKCIGYQDEPTCVDDGLPEQTCASDADCSAHPSSSCSPKLNSSVDYCYPTGDCYPGTQTVCSYPTRACTDDSECTGSSALCIAPLHNVGCDYFECLADTDCPADQKCGCGGCVPAACHADDDCSAGQRCQQEQGCIGKKQGFYCTTRDDECATSADCSSGRCVATPSAWKCTEDPCPAVSLP
jgi:hypothetical protein